MHFSIIGWCIIVGGVLFSSAGGMLLGRYATETDTFLVAGRKVRKFLLTSSGQAMEVGIVAVMMMTQEGYINGPIVLAFPIIVLLTFLVTAFTGFCVYGLRQSGSLTLGDYAQKRFGSRNFRVFTGVSLMIAGISTLAMFPAAVGTFFTFFLGWPTQTHILGFAVNTSALVAGVYLSVIVIYTLYAGSTGLIFADFLQYFLIWIGLIAVAAYASHDASWGHIVDTFSGARGHGSFNIFTASNYGVGWIVFMLIQNLYGSIVWPPAVSRILSCKTPKVSKQFYFLTGLMQPGRIAILSFAGLAAATAITASQLPPADKVLLASPTLAATPMYVATILPSIWLAVFFLAILCAEISGTDGYILAWSGIATHDLTLPLFKKELSERDKVRINKLFVVVIGVLVYLWGRFFVLSESMLTYIMLSGASYCAGAAAFLTCGLYWKRANATGAWCGMIGGMALPVVSMVTTGFMGQSFLAMKWVGILSYVLAFAGVILGTFLGERFGLSEAGGRPDQATCEVEAGVEA